MSDAGLVVSRPPYAADALAPAMAQIYGLTAAEVRMRLLFPLTEIWSVCATPEAAGGLTAQLNDAGVASWHVARSELDSIPRPVEAASFQMSSESLSVVGVGAASSPPVVMPWTTISHLLVMQDVTETNRAVEGREKKGATGKGMKRAAFAMDMVAPGLGRLMVGMNKAAKGKRDSGPGMRTEKTRLMIAEVYARVDGKVLRCRFSDGRTGYAGLGVKMEATGQQNWTMLIDELKARLPHALIDEKAVKTSPRTPTLLAPPSPWPAAVPGRLPSPIDLFSALMFLSPHG